MARGGSYLLNIGPMADGSLHPAHAERIRRIGDWYAHMEGCLECHEPDEFDYQLRGAGHCIAVKKDGKTYLHFFDGLMSSCVAFGQYPSVPKSVRLMNTGASLPFSEEKLPGFIDQETGVIREARLCIRDIPVDELSAEPIVLEIEWP